MTEPGNDPRLLIEAVRHVMAEQQDSTSKKILDTLARTSVGLVVALGVWGVGLREQVSLLEQRMETIEARGDAPSWLKEDLAEIKQAVRAIPDLVSRVSRLEEHVAELDGVKKK